MMYEFHGWFALLESTYEDDHERLAAAVAELEARVSRLAWPTASADIKTFNGTGFLVLNGLVNRRRHEVQELAELIDWIANRLPGSYGLLYERNDDDEPAPPGPHVFAVRVLARGGVTERLDPFLSPTLPVIEDPEPPGAETQ